ncbi:hypothetical protein [Salidesulfovibrio onnuriiensis]|uniref:hypothetical protein n=1 Tax=Salidesulfovibrio onnuriiensis TaxID=2583823 RepID=UPI0011C966E8|nr:hypothetical protein [Salidesulfovibrio onnuriiensis]
MEKERLTLDDMSREELVELIERLQWRTFYEVTQDDLCLVRVRLMQRRADEMLCQANDQLVLSRTCSAEWWEAQAKFDRAMELRKEARDLFAFFGLNGDEI